MDQLLIQLLSGNLNVEMLLILIIMGFVFKRIVPWWVHDEVVQELKKYEEDAPQLMEAVRELTEEVRTQGMKSSKLDQVEEKQAQIRRRYHDGPYHSARRRDRNE